MLSFLLLYWVLLVVENEQQQLSGWRWENGIIVASSDGKKMEEREQWAREEEKRTIRCEVEEEGCKIKGEGGAGWQWGAFCGRSTTKRERGMPVEFCS
jgi:hypothetical protein